MAEDNKLTIKDLAEMAHVAKSSVSKALNGQKGVGEETRNRILKLANTLKFEPNSSARALAQNKTYAIGFVLPQEASFSIVGEFWTAILAAVSTTVSSRGYSLVVITPPFGSDNVLPALEPLLRRHQIDGLIIGAEDLDRQSTLIIESQNIPFVFIGHNSIVNHYCIEVNNVESAEKLVSELVSQGYTKIGCIAGPKEYIYTQERVQGFVNIMNDRKLESHRVLFTSYENSTATEDILSMFKQYPDMDALYVTAGGVFILNIFKAAKKLNKNMQHMGLAIFDDSPYLDFLDMKVIIARQPLARVGKKAADILFTQIDGKTPTHHTELESVDIVYRGLRS